MIRRRIGARRARALRALVAAPSPAYRAPVLASTSKALAQRRRSAAYGALGFLDRVTRRRGVVEQYGSSLLYSFAFLATTAKDAQLAAWGEQIAWRCLGTWRRTRARAQAALSPTSLLDATFAIGAAARLGARDEETIRALNGWARHFEPVHLLGFDPLTTAPPENEIEACTCGANGTAGRRCGACGATRARVSRYKSFCVALTTAYCGDAVGVRLGANYADVLRWIGAIRPYPRHPRDFTRYHEALYCITHVVYTLNDYGRYRLAREWLAEEFDFLTRALRVALEIGDPDMVGECLDSLMAFRIDERDEGFRAGIEFLLDAQHADGSFGDLELPPLARCHATWAALDGLREFRWRPERLRDASWGAWLGHRNVDRARRSPSLRTRRS